VAPDSKTLVTGPAGAGFGCGTGSSAVVLAEQGATVIGAEPLPFNLAIAVQRATDLAVATACSRECQHSGAVDDKVGREGVGDVERGCLDRRRACRAGTVVMSSVASCTPHLETGIRERAIACASSDADRRVRQIENRLANNGRGQS
jgi:hypothetical protein